MKKEHILTHDFIVNRFKDAVYVNHTPTYGLLYPFVPPCIDGEFKCLFYWDTYFTNKGLIRDGYLHLAIYNTLNLLYLLDKYGFVPNSNSKPGIIHNSQPPYLHLMVKDIYEITHDEQFLKYAYFILKKEYHFWMKERMTPCGLNRYYHHKKTKQECIDFYQYVTTRLDIDKNIDDNKKAFFGECYNACCESGHDFSPRFKDVGINICPIDLNCLLYMFEENMINWSSKFDCDCTKMFKDNLDRRLSLINKFCFNKEDGLYYDYDFIKGNISQKSFNYTAQFFPFIANIASDKKVCLHLLGKLEQEFGISSTSIYDNKLDLQHCYPYSWPYENGLCFLALTKLRLDNDAIRIGNKYLELCATTYLKTGRLWEVYNAITNDKANKKEYPNTEMMGWTAGVFELIYEYIKEKEESND